MVARAETTSESQFRRRFLRSGLRNFRAEANGQRSRITDHYENAEVGSEKLEANGIAALPCSNSQLLTSNPSLHANLFRYPSLASNAEPEAVSPKHEMMQAVNTGHVTGKNFTAYDKITVNGEKVVSRGLLQRREAEYKIFSERKP